MLIHVFFKHIKIHLCTYLHISYLHPLHPHGSYLTDEITQLRSRLHNGPLKCAVEPVLQTTRSMSNLHETAIYIDLFDHHRREIMSGPLKHHFYVYNSLHTLPTQMWQTYPHATPVQSAGLPRPHRSGCRGRGLLLARPPCAAGGGVELAVPGD